MRICMRLKRRESARYEKSSAWHLRKSAVFRFMPGGGSVFAADSDGRDGPGKRCPRHETDGIGAGRLQCTSDGKEFFPSKEEKAVRPRTGGSSIMLFRTEANGSGSASCLRFRKGGGIRLQGTDEGPAKTGLSVAKGEMRQDALPSRIRRQESQTGPVRSGGRERKGQIARTGKNSGGGLHSGRKCDRIIRRAFPRKSDGRTGNS